MVNLKKPENPLLTMSAWVGAFVVIIGGMLAAVDGRYAQKTTVVRIESARALDSLNYVRDRREILGAISRLDSNVTCVRKPEKDWCK
jgi:predicted membrane-bound mannosyltransferase